ncbi:endoplasmic reticulum-Golgi intermediate compartment protein 3 [Strongylocentrotus purpuratus]|uniref:Endoplasmic reticulum-Golgi intermediate compartment protein 3 n=1 Tax=Strongylocentrotus purpuratus TaxID=7668 RepID=A0A7M7STA5_STRPU|nr:endoplasmic reticulum-Golgi intermediate compartment protein 3 [Strongylocentrotus purpuratus]|eukprot:XP_792057.3 PREDICTED: endoplasmic reticulum-Golgi intermediate compartment protein 3 [Strongylocentrotus purpuratus]
MAIQDVWNRLREFDAYPKTLEDFRVKTFGGAAVTIISSIIMITLFISELNFYLTKEVIPELYVDATRGEKLKINMEIVFPKMPCAYLSIDAMDISGEQQLDVDHNIYKRRIDKTGTPISEPEKEELGKKEDQEKKEEEDSEQEDEKKKMEVLDPNRCESCYGAETPGLKCCNDCEGVQEAYRRKGWAFSDPTSIEQCKREGFSEKMQSQKEEGCELYGYLEVNKVAGNFHFAPGKSFQQHHVHVHDLQAIAGAKFNMTHHVKTLSFGMEYPGMENPLDNMKTIDVKGSSMFQYFVKIVPTTYTKLDKSITRTNQYSVTKHEKQVTTSFSTGEHGLPGVFVLYELSPLMVKFTEKHRSFMHFLTGVCAIIGGVFTVAGLIDSLIYHSAKAIQKKIDLGKAL